MQGALDAEAAERMTGVEAQLTRALLEAGAGRVLAVELDRRAIRAIEELRQRRPHLSGAPLLQEL